jgi:hypothetical protein
LNKYIRKKLEFKVRVAHDEQKTYTYVQRNSVDFYKAGTWFLMFKALKVDIKKIERKKKESVES